MFLPRPEHKNEVNRLGSDIIRAQTTFAAGTWIFHGNFPGQDKLMNSNSDCDGDCECSCASYSLPPLPSPLSQFSRSWLGQFPQCVSVSHSARLSMALAAVLGRVGLVLIFSATTMYYILYSLCHWPISFGYFYQQRHQPAASSRARSWRANFQLFASISFRGLWNGTNLLKRQLQRLGTDRNWPKTVFCQLHSSRQCAVINTLTIIPCSYWKRWKLFIVHWSRDWL